MSKVYVVTTGCYSDYGIRGIFSTKDKAQKYVSNCEENSEVCYHSDFNSIAEWDLDEGLQERAFKTWYLGMMLDDGTIEKWGDRESRGEQDKWGIPKNDIDICEQVPGLNNRPAVRVVSVKSEKHAMKLAVEASGRS